MGYISMKNFFNFLTLNFIFILSVQASLLEDLPEIKYETFKLDNGLTVIVTFLKLNMKLLSLIMA